MRPVSYTDLALRIAWVTPWVNRACSWALKAPAWLPGSIARAPLIVLLAVYEFEHWRLRNGR
jgi:hypothetical protein